MEDDAREEGGEAHHEEGREDRPECPHLAVAVAPSDTAVERYGADDAEAKAQRVEEAMVKHPSEIDHSPQYEGAEDDGEVGGRTLA